MDRIMQVELIQDWRGYRVGARFPMEVIGGGVFDVLQRNRVARLLSEPNDQSEGSGDSEHDQSGDTTNERASDDRRGQGATQHRGKRR